MKLNIMTSLLFALMLFSGAQPIIAGDGNDVVSVDDDAENETTIYRYENGATSAISHGQAFAWAPGQHSGVDCQKDPDRCLAIVDGKDDPGPSEPAPENSTAEDSGASKALAKLMDMKKNHPESIKKMSKEDFLTFLEKHRPSRTTEDHARKPTDHAKPGHVNKPRHQAKPRQRPQRRPGDK